ncbi:MAG: peptide ABC transporter substrate-binding protein [Candidatus Dormiibacterota bacterium]
MAAAPRIRCVVTRDRPRRRRIAMRARVLTIAVALSLLAVACGGNAQGPQSTKLAANQTLNIPVFSGSGVVTLDPGHVSDFLGVALLGQMFTGLLGFDQHLNIVPSIAKSLPSVSSDGLTYTFHLRHDVKFSNGDPVTSQDVLYSWDRTASLQDTYALVFDPVVGSQAVASGSTTTLSGLSAPDPYTVVAHLQYPAGYWETEVAIWPAAIVDRKAIEAGGQDTWWNDPKTAVGTGPFRLTQYTPNASIDFAPVGNWWGGSTGTLKHIHLDEGLDPTSAVKKYEARGYDVVGWGSQTPSNDDILRYERDPTKKSQLHIYPGSATEWLSYSFLGSSPFAPRQGLQPGQATQGIGQDQGKGGRDALSLAVNRNQLVNVACAGGTTCNPGTGGYISKGLAGYVGDNSDPSAPAGGDRSKAKAEYRKWDPPGQKLAGLRVEFSSNPTNNVVWQNYQAQVKEALGVNLTLYPTDTKTSLADGRNHKIILGASDWGADYNHPQDWFDNLFVCSQTRIGGHNGSGYCDPSMDKIVAKADQQPLSQSLSQYKQAGQMLSQNDHGAVMFYTRSVYLTQPYVQGAANNGLYDSPWRSMRILQH